MYNKLFTKILDSSIWLAPDTDRLVWITLLAAMDEDGLVQFASVENLAHRARVDPAEAKAAVDRFEGPDEHSGDPDNEGRRIERIPGGWIVLNAIKYRNLVSREVAKERTRERVAKHRASHRDSDPSRRDVTLCNGHVTPANVSVTPSEAEAEANTEAEPEKRVLAGKTPPTYPFDFDEFKRIYPKRAGDQGWREAMRRANARIREGVTWDEILAGASRYAAHIRAAGNEGSVYVKKAETFLGPEKHFLLPWDAPPTKADLRYNANANTARQWAAKVTQ